MVDPSRAQTVDGEITKHCAYNLPAVAYTLGRQNWHCIKNLYETLAQDMQVAMKLFYQDAYKVKRLYVELIIVLFLFCPVIIKLYAYFLLDLIFRGNIYGLIMQLISAEATVNAAVALKFKYPSSFGIWYPLNQI